MTDPAAQPPAQSSAAQPVPTWESRLPGWQQWINTFCENWIFAFIVAMAIRHFCVEAFRIPTASMEPMLYGDPAFSKADHVVVDKFLFRFTGPSRWGVTVFQFPQPEVEPVKGEQTDARTAITADGSRLDRVLVRPLMYRNFVKRAVILPGDTWYIAGGNVYLKQPDGSFKVSRKPPSVQEQVWQEIYRFGAQVDYQPWIGEGGSVAATGDDGALTFTLKPDGGLRMYPQQFRNLYLKPGQFRVRPNNRNGAAELIELSMTNPQFIYQATRTKGNAWDLDAWELRRMNSADLDHLDQGDQDAGTVINRSMDEWVGDVRLRARLAELKGDVALDLTQGNQHAFRLQLTSSGWTVLADGKQIGAGSEPVLMTDITFGILDDQVLLTIDGKELVRFDLAPNNPELHRVGARWRGNGSVSFSRLAMDRDVHYCLGDPGSILRNEAQHYQEWNRNAELAKDSTFMPAFDRDSEVKRLRDLLGVRAQMLGKASIDDLKGDERWQARGISPETALTAPPGAYLMLGDNSPRSWDSRCWGYVPSENLRGQVLAVVLPFSRWRVVR